MSQRSTHKYRALVQTVQYAYLANPFIIVFTILSFLHCDSEPIKSLSLGHRWKLIESHKTRYDLKANSSSKVIKLFFQDRLAHCITLHGDKRMESKTLLQVTISYPESKLVLSG